MSRTSQIILDISLDNDKIPEKILWTATDSEIDEPQKAEALFVSLWDSSDKSTLSIDLWTKDMMVNEMALFYCQILEKMSETFSRATNLSESPQLLKKTAKEFIELATKEMQKNQDSAK